MAALLNSDLPRSISNTWRQQLRKTLNIRQSSSGTPKFNHDRCERSVQMRLYTLSKGQFALVFAICLLVFVILLMIGLAGPPITAVRQRRAKDLPKANTTNLAVGPIAASSPVLSTYCQQLWVIAKFRTADSRRSSLHEIYETSFRMSVEMLASTKYADMDDLLANDRRPGPVQNISLTLRCQDDVCDEIIVAHLGFIAYHQYHFVFRLYGLQAFNERFPIEDIVFYFKSYSPSFSRLALWFRFGFAVVALLATIWFHRNLRPYPLLLWSLEQKWIAVLLPLLLLFNDPLFPLIFLVDSSLPSVVDSIFQATFLCTVLLFWLCIYHGIKQTNRPFMTFYLPKLTLVTFMWFAIVFLSILHWVAALHDVGSGHSSWEASRGVRMFFYVIGSVYLVYLAVLIIRSYKELRNLPYFDIRLKFFTVFVAAVIGVTVAVNFLHFGITSVLEDNFASLLSTSYNSSAQFIAFYGLMNCYLLTMAFVYSPNPNVVPEIQMNEQPPPSASALLNSDSEDELYGPEVISRGIQGHFGEGESDGD